MRKRPDGFHEIASLFQAVDLFDRLFFSPSLSDQITCSDPTLPLDGRNLVVRALKLFRSHYASSSVEIHIEKNIPIESGFGGGSSNAATTLWALNELFGRPASLKELIEIGAMIGSDVPFFFSAGTAYCTGRGEIMQPYQLPKPLKGFLAKPHYGLSTPIVYQATIVDYLPDRSPLESLQNYPSFFNDLEFSAFQIEPRLKDLQEFLLKHFETVIMTGSGTAFFCLHGTPPKIPGLQFWPFTTLQRSEEKWYTAFSERRF